MCMSALRCLELLSALLDVSPRHSGAQDCVPVNEERLREIGLDPDSLKLRLMTVSVRRATSESIRT